MEDEQTVRDRTEVQFPRDAMGVERDPSTVVSPYAEDAVTVPRGSGPDPTLGALVHLGPEPPFDTFHEESLP
jgi:hypothetical protein